MRKRKAEDDSRMEDHFFELDVENDMPYEDADPESTSHEWSLLVPLRISSLF